MRRIVIDTAYQMLGGLHRRGQGLHRRGQAKFIVLAHGRTGGTTLLRLLGAHPSVRYVDEPLARRVAKPLALIEGRAAASAYWGKAWGCKIKAHWHLMHTQELKSPAEFLQSAVAAGWLIILLRRENIARQTVASLVRLCGDGLRYHSDSTYRVHVPLEKVAGWIKAHERNVALEEELAREVPVLRVSYERDLLDPAMRQICCDRLFANLGLPPHSVSAVDVRTEPDDLGSFVRNAEALYRQLNALGHDYNSTRVRPSGEPRARV